jgi:hypothetical protein
VADFQKAAQEIFEILRSFDYTVALYDHEGADVTEPEEARRFYDHKANLMVSLIDDDDNSRVELSYGQSTHANDILGLDQNLKRLATDYALGFSAQQDNKVINPKGMNEDKRMLLALVENMYGTSLSSYLRLENARMIVRHSKRIDDSRIGARGRCVEHIFIENAHGERFLFPGRRLAPARAMTQHVNQGGSLTDEVGSQIKEMNEDYANLGAASGFINLHSASLTEGAMAVREACRDSMRKLRKTFERLSRPSSYALECDAMKQSKALNENAVDETRITELRQLLNDADLPREVYECACKAMKMREAIVEANEPDDDEHTGVTWDEMTNILGVTVNRQAWEQFRSGILPVTMRNSPLDQRDKDFNGKYEMMLFRLGNLIPRVADPSIANLLDHVTSTIKEMVETKRVPTRVTDSNNDRKSWKRTIKGMIQIAAQAISARKPLAEPKKAKLATGNAAVKEHLAWFDLFDPNKVLAEDFGMGEMDIGFDSEEDAKFDAQAAFDANDFINSPEVADLTRGMDAHDPATNSISHDDLEAALSTYMQRHIETFSSYVGSGMDVDTHDLIDAVFDEASQALHDEGWVVQTIGNDETSLEESADDTVLTMDDILIPKPDQGDSLRREVTPTLVDDPATGKKRRPDASYIDAITSRGFQNNPRG